VLAGWDSTERVGPDGTIELTQRALLPRPAVRESDEGAFDLAAGYWRAVRAVTYGLVRARETSVGVDLRLLGFVLLAFHWPETHVDSGEVACRLRIRGGFLAGLPHGALTLAQVADGPAIESTIEGYSPRLTAHRSTRALYVLVQQRLHAAVSRRFFRQLIAEAGG
jgi:hypothetical protein